MPRVTRAMRLPDYNRRVQLHSTSSGAHIDATRQARFDAWRDEQLRALGLRQAGAPTRVAGDASFRAFWRVPLEQGSVIAMDAPPATENNAQFVRLSRLFRAHGVAVPEVFACDLDAGFLLVSDLGTQHYADVYGTTLHDTVLEQALVTLVRLQHMPNSTGVIPAYTATRFRDELALFRTWLVAGLLHIEMDARAVRLFEALETRLVDNVLEQPRVCVHRDYHSRNLLWQTSCTTGFVDFQDALWGPVAYDLASLLRDCYVRFPEDEIARWQARYLALAFDDRTRPGAERFARWLDWTAVQRQLKALGIFARLDLRNARPAHLVHVVPVLDHLIDIAAHYAELSALSDWLRASVRPVAARAVATRLPARSP